MAASLGDWDADAAAAETVLALIEARAGRAVGATGCHAARRARGVIWARAIALGAGDAADVADAALACDAEALLADEAVGPAIAEALHATWAVAGVAFARERGCYADVRQAAKPCAADGAVWAWAAPAGRTFRDNRNAR